MLPGTFSFFLFVAATVAACFLAPKRIQWLVLLAASLLYYATFATRGPRLAFGHDPCDLGRRAGS